MSTVRDRRTLESMSRERMGKWFFNYWRTLRYWRAALRRDPRDASLPHWPLPNLTRNPIFWPRRVFTECACKFKDTWV